MKKLLGVIGILALAAALLPAQGYADLRGAFAPITIASGFVNGCEQPAHRYNSNNWPSLNTVPQFGLNDGRLYESWFTFSTRSLVPGRESVRSIWMHYNVQQAPLVFGNGTIAPLLNDPAANTSWFDPAWSHDGRFMAYVQTDANGTNQQLYVQEYYIHPGNPLTDALGPTEAGLGLSGYVCDGFEAANGHCYVSEGDSTDLALTYVPGLDTPIGPPILVLSTNKPRHPSFHPSRYELALDWDDAGSIDVYTIDLDANDDNVIGDLGMPVRRTFLEVKGEEAPSWAPNGHDIVYSTNRFGPSVLEIIDLNLPSMDPGYTRLVETNFNFVSHRNPDFDSQGLEVWYDAPSGEDASLPASIWKINLATQAKCEIQFDVRTDADPDVSNFLQDAQSGAGVINYNYVLYSSQAANFGLNVWRTNPINSCVAPLPMGVAFDPSVINLKSNGQAFKTTMRFPPETKAAGYVCRSSNSGGEGVRLRGSLYGSPTLLGLMAPTNPALTPGGVTTVSNSNCVDVFDGPANEWTIECYWSRREISDRMVALGLTDQTVPLEMLAYSNNTGRPFRGFAYMQVTGSQKAAPATLLRNSPNPFNPVTKIQFAIGAAGRYSVKIFNVRGELVRTLSNQHYDIGTHEAMWDGRTTGGGKAASGIYLAKIVGAGTEESSSLRLVLAK